jgi:hypothetical protein
VAVLGGILGVLVGFVVGALFTEVLFANNSSWPDLVPFVLAVLGAVAGAQLGRRLRAQRGKAHLSS